MTKKNSAPMQPKGRFLNSHSGNRFKYNNNSSNNSNNYRGKGRGRGVGSNHAQQD